MTTTGNNGRLGNQIIRNLAVSLIAEKHNLKVDYFNKDLIDDKLGIKLFSGSNVHNACIQLNDHNYFAIHNCDELNHNLDPNSHYFQTKEITNMLHNHLHSGVVKSNIIEKNPFSSRYNANNDLFVHVRLTDAAQWNPGIDYYLRTIRPIHYDHMYISTDDVNHSFVQTLLTLPNSTLINYDEITTIQFGSTCKHLVLSHGSFSAVIGYVSYFSTMYYQEYNHPGPNLLDYSINIWYGDMFSINGWVKC